MVVFVVGRLGALPRERVVLAVVPVACARLEVAALRVVELAHGLSLVAQVATVIFFINKQAHLRNQF